MKFFVPEMNDEQIAEVWQHHALRGERPIYSVTYEHERSKFVVTVGDQRQEYRRETGPRGGYIKNAEYERRARSTGSMVMLILDVGGVLQVHSMLPSRGWANPSFIGSTEIRSIESFTPPSSK